MNAYIIFLFIVFSYFFIVFILIRLIVPFLGFKKHELPKEIPFEMESVIIELKKVSKDKNDFLRKAYDFLIKKYHGARLQTIVRLDLLFLTDLEKIWGRPGYIPCSTHNHLLRIFLVKSGFFNDAEIRLKHKFVNFNIHQHLQVKVDDDWMNVDPAGDYFGMRFGEITPMFK